MIYTDLLPLEHKNTVLKILKNIETLCCLFSLWEILNWLMFVLYIAQNNQENDFKNQSPKEDNNEMVISERSHVQELCVVVLSAINLLGFEVMRSALMPTKAYHLIKVEQLDLGVFLNILFVY